MRSVGMVVGREPELAALRALAEEVRRSRELRVAVVAGEAGMGKTTLLEAFVGHLEGAAVLRGECLDLGSARLPYAPVLQALRPVMHDPGRWGLTIEEPARANLARLVPELGQVAPVPSGMSGIEVGQTQLFEHLLDVVRQTAAAADLLVLALEDVHFSEPATADLLAFLVGNLIGVPVLGVMTVRADEVGRRHPARPLLSSLERSSRATRIDLSPLGAADLAALLQEALPATPVTHVDEVLDRSGGNPLFALELAAGDGVSDQLADLLLARVECCDAATQQVLRVVAAAGEDVDDDALAAVTGLPYAQLTAGLREAVDQRLVVVTGGGDYRFRHALIAEAVEQSLLPVEVRAIHRALGDRFALDGGNAGPHAGRLARHHRAAGRVDDELEAAYAAGMRAVDLVAYKDAQALLERVAELWPQVPDASARLGTELAEVYQTAAVCAISVLDHRRGVALAEQGLVHVDAAADPERAALLHMWVGHGHDDDWAKAEPALRTALATLPL